MSIPDALNARPFSCFILLGASLKIDTFPLCELTIINYYWTNSEQELWKMRQKTACPGSESDILMPFWQTRERERIQNKLQTLALTICTRRLWINILQRIILCIIWLRPCYILLRFSPYWERAGPRSGKCFIGLVMARNAAMSCYNTGKYLLDQTFNW